MKTFELFALKRKEHREKAQRKMETPLMEEDWVVLCHALCQSIGEEARSDMVNIGVKKAGQRLAGMGKLAWRESDKEPFFSPKTDLQAAFNKRSELREAFVEVSYVDFHKAMKVCEEQPATVKGRKKEILFHRRRMCLNLRVFMVCVQR